MSRARSTEFLLLYGLIGRTTRFADANMKLVRLDHVHEAVPLARAALKHAVTAQWVFPIRGGIDRNRYQVADAVELLVPCRADQLGSPLAGELFEASGDAPDAGGEQFGTLRELVCGKRDDCLQLAGVGRAPRVENERLHRSPISCKIWPIAPASRKPKRPSLLRPCTPGWSGRMKPGRQHSLTGLARQRRAPSSHRAQARNAA